jgi:hypothetical protein
MCCIACVQVAGVQVAVPITTGAGVQAGDPPRVSWAPVGAPFPLLDLAGVALDTTGRMKGQRGGCCIQRLHNLKLNMLRGPVSGML